MACGFHLRGPVELSPALKETRIEGIAEFSQLGVELKKALINGGAKVLPSSAKTSLSTITISDEKYVKRVLSVDSQGRASEYGLVYSFKFNVTGEKKNVMVDTQKIEVIRDYRFNPNSVLAMDTEEAKIRSDMIKFAVNQLIRRVNATLSPKT